METTLAHLQTTINSNPNYQPGVYYEKEDILKLIQTDMIAVPEHGRIFSTLLPDDTLNKLQYFQDWELTTQLYYIVTGTAHNNHGEWTIYLFVSRAAISSFNEINLTVLLITSLVSMLIASVFGLYAQHNIATPIINLTNKVKDFRVKLTPLEHSIFTGDEIQDLDESLVVMADDILGNDRRRKSFFENTSHELKTPLMSIRGYAEGLKDGIFEVDEAADVILSESESLRLMVEDILYLSKLEDASIDRYQFQVLESNEFLTGFYQKMRPLVQERGLNFILLLDRSVEVNLDDEKMIRALSNIITNAIRYAKQQIIIKTIIENGYLHIRISNDGPKVSEENISKLFDRFFKGVDGQSGLGLAIVRTILSAHQGSAEAFNTETGFCMNIKLPCVYD
ncbi:MAG: HAMP domain-containing histidine kinase [Turicibacter sp.]|nr:HAMP domain-containing histidine kinase [Turicibacter sp.]